MDELEKIAEKYGWDFVKLIQDEKDVGDYKGIFLAFYEKGKIGWGRFFGSGNDVFYDTLMENDASPKEYDEKVEYYLSQNLEKFKKEGIPFVDLSEFGIGVVVFYSTKDRWQRDKKAIRKIVDSALEELGIKDEIRQRKEDALNLIMFYYRNKLL